MAFFALDALVDLLPVNSHILGSVDSLNQPVSRIQESEGQLLHLRIRNKQTVQLARWLRIRDSTPASAFPKFSGCVPPACAKSARPPPLPPTCAATALAISPALIRFSKSAETPATSTTLPSWTVASTTTEDPSLPFS